VADEKSFPLPPQAPIIPRFKINHQLNLPPQLLGHPSKKIHVISISLHEAPCATKKFDKNQHVLNRP
jgi:hypothetical protein